jgi:hypothetical protein
MQGYENRGPGRGFGMGRGFGGGGRGWRHWFHATGLPGWMRFGGRTIPCGYTMPYGDRDPEMEKQALRNQAEAMEMALNFIKKRLAEVETETPAK